MAVHWPAELTGEELGVCGPEDLAKILAKREGVKAAAVRCGTTPYKLALGAICQEGAWQEGAEHPRGLTEMLLVWERIASRAVEYLE